MLVLSRRQQDKIVFPGLGITVHVVRIEGKTVRLGVEAPERVRVLRHELSDRECTRAGTPDDRPGRLTHALRNRLNAATIGLELLRRQLEIGHLPDADATLARIFHELGAMEAMAATIQDTTAIASAARRVRALLVEDNENEAALLAAYLQTVNYDVRRVRDGVEALDYLSHDERPDVVLLDMSMPRLDGSATIREIRSNPSHAGLKVFAVTGMSREASRIPIGPGGADRWFQKPIKPDVLVREIDRELARDAIPA
jgi:carbon storage regulator CsrA